VRHCPRYGDIFKQHHLPTQLNTRQKAYPRHCERSEAIHASRAKERMDCFVASAPRNDGERSFAISPQVCARFDLEFSAF
jgi:hypothetical protein